jgi:hypothetical protein
MTKIKCMLVLFIIFTGSLFSQDGINEILEEDTITLINTAVVTEIDTVVIEESVSEAGEKIDLSNYDFYSDYLDYIKKTNSIDDVLIMNECKKTGMISAKAGIGFFIGTASLSLDIPLDNKTAMLKYVKVASGGVDGVGKVASFFGFGPGFVTKRTENFIFKLNMCIGAMSDFGERKIWGIGGGVGADMLFKVFKPCYFSIGPDIIIGHSGDFIGVISLGLNLVY